MTIRNAFTSIFAALLCILCLGACGEGAPISTPVKIVIFGDSLTAGYKLPASESVPARLQERFMAAGHSGVRVINMGISGDTTQEGLSRFNLALEAEPDIVVLELGANDIMRHIPAKKMQENLDIMIRQLQERGIVVILSGVSIPAAYAIGNEQLGEYKPAFEALADTYSVEYYPNFLAGVQGKPEMNLQDGLHPNSKGIEEIANRLYPLLREAAHEVAERK